MWILEYDKMCVCVLKFKNNISQFTHICDCSFILSPFMSNSNHSCLALAVRSRRLTITPSLPSCCNGNALAHFDLARYGLVCFWLTCQNPQEMPQLLLLLPPPQLLLAQSSCQVKPLKCEELLCMLEGVWTCYGFPFHLSELYCSCAINSLIACCLIVSPTNTVRTTLPTSSNNYNSVSQ